MRTVIIVVFDDLRLLDRAGPVDMLESASELGAAPYRTVVGSVGGPSVRSGSGVEIGVDVSMIQMSAGVSPRSVVGLGGVGLYRKRSRLALRARRPA